MKTCVLCVIAISIVNINFTLSTALDTNLIQQIKSSVSTSMSSTSTFNSQHTSWKSINAIDGVFNGNPDTCSCCAGTLWNTNAWWEIDLGRPYTIGRIKIYGRMNGSNKEQYSDLNVFVGKSSNISYGTLVHKGNPTDGAYIFNILINTPIPFQYLFIKRYTANFLTICEVKMTEYSEGYGPIVNLLDINPNEYITSQSDVLSKKPDSFGASKAIDRQTNYSIDSCKCCSVTENIQNKSWWQLNLARKYDIYAIEVFGRQTGNNNNQLEHAEIHASNASKHTGMKDAILLYTVPTINTSSHFVKHLDQPVTAQYLIVTLNFKHLTLCEFNVYGIGPVCDIGYFGVNCSQSCHCADGQRCNNSTGTCKTNTCQPGWQGVACNEACRGTYGRNCENQCSKNCFGGIEHCNTVNGTCMQGCELGFSGVQCRTPCRGTYGRNCENQCSKNCFGGIEHCNTVNGTCMQGCELGFSGVQCRSQCPEGYFGNCSFQCHCINGTACSKTDGSCDVGCDFGWDGFNCSTDQNIIQGSENVSQSGIFLTYDAHKAIDHRDSYDVDNCTCCSVTNGTVPSWWRIDFEEQILIAAIRIYGREDLKHSKNTAQLENATVYVGNETTMPSDIQGLKVYQIPTIHDTYVFTKILDTATIAQSIIVSHLRKILTICEFKVYKKVCDIGRFGTGCSHECHCSDGKKCDPVTGACQTSGCYPGWRGHSCELGCPIGHFGDECARTCHCINGTDCENVKGTCQVKQCDPGWVTDTCEMACNNGTFGPECNKTCHCLNQTLCNNVDGTCDIGKCEPGWIGPACDTQCEERHFGDGCKTECHCINGTKCDHINGTCEHHKCEPGWRVDSCSTECSKRHYGPQCNLTCHCFNDTGCNNVDGTCDVSKCESGWMGGACDKGCPIGHFGDECARTCHCINGTDCDNAKGTCEVKQCDPGWVTDTCEMACGDGTFGLDCNETCHCLNQTLCNNVNGTCDIGECEPGWIGKACDSPCSNGTFGPECNKICHCLNQTSCNNVNGTCDIGECEPGWIGQACDSPCNNGTFGPECNKICHCLNQTSCNNVNGTCDIGKCEPGWIGQACDTPCGNGTFGPECSLTCHCLNQTSCNNVNGTCDIGECEPGWIGKACDSQCTDKTFGQNCNSTCHCLSRCHHVSGSCIVAGVCEFDYEGEDCDIKRLSQTKDSDTGAIAGGSVGAVIGLLALGALIAVVFYRKRNQQKDQQSDRKQFSDITKRSQTSQSRETISNTNAHVNTAYVDVQETSMNNIDDGDYYSFGGQTFGIKIHELWDYIKDKMENKCEYLYEEFKKLPSGLVHPCNSADDLSNKGKNRYREMYAYDHSRVILEEVVDGVNTDYINACYVNGFDKTKKFVASQGPTKQMVDDFWRMVWQLKSDKIVMLTDLIELGAIKCFQYWPKEGEEDEHSFGDVVVKVTKTVKFLDYIIRDFEVRKINEPARRIRQFHFKSWPDKDVPDSTWCLASFWRAVDTNAHSKAGPIVVHCSAGVGRTGTFIALDNLVSQAQTEGCVRPLQMVEALRRQRVNMVQTREQYVYLHEVVADVLLFGTHFIWTKQFGDVFNCMVKKGKGETTTNLQKQFDLIEQSTINIDENDTAEYSNIEIIHSESDAYRPKLKNRGSKYVQELAALYIPSYKGRNTFLTCMSPDKHTIEEFWSLVDDNNIKTIIMLTENIAPSYQTSCQLGASSNSNNRFNVQKIEEKLRKGFTERTFTFRESDREEEEYLTTVKQFQHTAWKDGSPVPDDTKSMIDMIEAVQRWQPHFSENQPILIHCGDGFSRTGVVCMFLNELQRMNYEGGHINVLESVKFMKKRQRHLIGTYEQYRYCFDLMLAHTKTTEVYENI